MGRQLPLANLMRALQVQATCCHLTYGHEGRGGQGNPVGGSLPAVCLRPAQAFLLASSRLTKSGPTLRESAGRHMKTWIPLCLLRIAIAVSLLFGTMAFEAEHAHASSAGIDAEEPHREQSRHSKSDCHAALRCNDLSTSESLVLPAPFVGARRLGFLPQPDLDANHTLRVATPPPRSSV